MKSYEKMRGLIYASDCERSGAFFVFQYIGIVNFKIH